MNLRLPHDVHFVVRHADRWRALLNAPDGAPVLTSVDDLHATLVTNEDCWIIATYLQLKRRVDNVFLSAHAAPAQMCVVSGLDMGIRSYRRDTFYIGARSDGPDPALCQLRVVQNELQAGTGFGHWIPHWPQPALRARRAERGTTVKTVAFYGSQSNLDPRFRTQDFLTALQGLGVRLRIHGREGADTVAWNDYGDVDVVLAARNLTRDDALTKPASKLVNAWLAGVPALLGPEPVFRALRRSEFDYIEVRSAADALRALSRLKSEPALYEAMVRNGALRADAFSVDAIAERWIGYLAGPASIAYEKWKRTGPIRRTATWLVNAPRHRLARARATYLREHGPRMLDSQTPVAPSNVST